MRKISIPDFTDAELWIVRTTLQERYRATCDIELAEAEIRLQPTDRETTPVPTLYWQAGDCHFVIFKTGIERYRCQFFYRIHQQYGTGKEEFDTLAECITTLLQVQADYAVANANP